MKTLRLILGDQLSFNLPTLRDIDPVKDIVLMAEVMAEVTYVKHHKRKIVFLFSAMRHFAQALEDEGLKFPTGSLMIPKMRAALRTKLQLPLMFLALIALL